MRSFIRLRVEPLEDRSVPAVFGTPWPDSNLTISFAPDGTDINGAPSNLTAMLSTLGANNGLSTSALRLEILRMYQTWAASANINIGLVGDTGDAYGTPGLIQGDTRFGDIRVGGRNLASDVGGLTSGYNNLNTQAGDAIINTGASFSLGGTASSMDFDTVVLHEAGHSFGIADNQDTGSVEYVNYQGVRTSLAPQDIAALQALYGARRPDAFEGSTGNDSTSTASAYSGPLTADLTTTNDVDYYRFTVATGAVAPMIRLQAAGLSLVEARVQVLNSMGMVIADAAAHDPTNNNVSITLPPFLPSGTYYVRVSSAATDVFGVGSYQLIIGTGSIKSTTAVAVDGSHGTFDAAAVLTQQIASVDDRVDYAARVTPDVTAAGNSFICIHAPTAAAGQQVNLVISASNVSVLQDMQVLVFDANQNLIATRVLTSVTGAVVVQADNVAADADYFIQVVSLNAFDLTADFTTRSSTLDLGATGDPSNGAQSGKLSVALSQTVHFALTATGDTGAAACMTVQDSSGNVVFTLVAAGGSSRSTDIFLAAGYYSVTMTILTSPNYGGGPLSYSVCGWGINDQIGALPVDPSGGSDGGKSNGGGDPPPVVDGKTVYWTATNPADGSMWY
jgi:hypothetical protein